MSMHTRTGGMAAVAAFALGIGLAQPAAAVDIQELTSPGGQPFWLVEEHAIPLVSLEMGFRGGSRLDPEGQVWAEGALWRAHLAEGSDTEPVPAGAHVRIVAVEGLTLVAVPAAAPAADREDGANRDTLSG